jgi:hypothetical protein
MTARRPDVAEGTPESRVERRKVGKIAEEIGLDDGVTALQQLGILKAA